MRLGYCMTDMSAKHKTFIGLMMAAGVVIGTKLLTLSSQWILGYYLEPEEFGEYGMILGVLAFVGFLQDPGVGRLHTQMQQTSGPNWHRSLMVTQAFAFIGGLLLILLVKLAYDSSDELMIMACFIAASFPLIAIYSLFKSRLEVANDYKTIAKYQLLSAVVYSFTVVLLAVLGFGSLSFAIAMFLAAAIVTAYVLLKTKYDHHVANIELQHKSQYFRGLLWAFIGSFVLGLSLRSDYFVVGITLTTRDLGIYYFGFMLAANVGLLLSQAMGSVLMPAFSSMNRNGSIDFLYINACRKMLVVAVVISLSGMAVLPYLIDWIWNGKWHESIVVCQLFLLTLPLKLLVPVSLAYLESQGNWKDRAICLGFDGITLAVFCWLGATYAGLVGAVAAAALQRGSLGLVTLFWSMNIAAKNPVGKSIRKLFSDVLMYILTITLAMLAIYYLSLESYVPVIIIAALVYVSFGLLFSRDVYKSIYEIVMRVLRRGRGSV